MNKLAYRLAEEYARNNSVKPRHNATRDERETYFNNKARWKDSVQKVSFYVFLHNQFLERCTQM